MWLINLLISKLALFWNWLTKITNGNPTLPIKFHREIEVHNDKKKSVHFEISGLVLILLALIWKLL